jgi:hypothetical protein
MNKKYLSLGLLAVFAVLPLRTYAALSLTEIMYDLEGTDTNREWVEVCNGAGDPVSLSGFKFNDGANHAINEPPTNGSVGSVTLSSQQCLVLAANATIFLSDNIGFSGTVLDTVMSLNNTEETISILNQNGEEQVSATYTNGLGAAGDGNSLQKSGDTFIPKVPTPGTYTENDDGEQPSEEDVPVTTPTLGSGGAAKKEEIIPPKITAELVLPRYVTSGTPLSFDAHVYGYSGENRTVGFFRYNFGDGTIYESETLAPYNYTYRYPGEYTYSFEYYLSKYSVKPEVRLEERVTVVDPTLAVSAILSDGAVTLTNKANRDIDLIGFKLVRANAILTLPQTIVRAGKSITLPASFTELTTGENVQLVLQNPSGATVSVYPATPQVVKKSTSKKVLVTKVSSPAYSVPLKRNLEKNDLGAVAVKSPKLGRTPLLYAAASLGSAAIGAGSFLYLRPKKKEDENEADGYTISEITDN